MKRLLFGLLLRLILLWRTVVEVVKSWFGR